MEVKRVFFCEKFFDDILATAKERFLVLSVYFDLELVLQVFVKDSSD